MPDLADACRAFITSPAYWDATPRQLALLGMICDTPGPHRVRILARELGLSKPVVTRAVQKLVRRGLLDSGRSREDARDVLIMPTEAGRAMRSALREPAQIREDA